MADNQISVTISADVAPLQSALQQASSAFESAAGTISSAASEIAANAKQAFDALAETARQASQTLVQTTQQTATQSLQAEQDYEARKRELQIQALAEEVARDEARIQQLTARLDRQLAEHQKYADNVRGVHRAAADDIAKIWDQAASQIDHALMSGFNRMIVSGGNFQQQMRKIAAQVETALLTAVEKTVLSWITGENAKTAATVAGTTARTAAEQSSGSVGLASMALKAIKAIANDAWQTFAGIFAFLSPEMGPAAAGPAAAGSATVMAAAGSIVSAAGGAWSLPNDMLVLAHREESILPAHIAGPMRDFFEGAGAGNGANAPARDVNFHVYAMDSRDVMNFFKRNGGTLAKVLKGEQRNFNPALASAFR
ncbi:MAG TPA: hypothetical protein VN823_10775 [Stellaceae bacterium]|nr:hypothetical protein [Stellaceae bacterium]